MIITGSIIQSTEQEAVCIPKGTKVHIANPDWDADKPETQYNVLVELDSDCYMWTCSSRDRITGKVLDPMVKFPEKKNSVEY